MHDICNGSSTCEKSLATRSVEAHLVSTVTYKHGCHNVVRQRKVLDPFLSWQRVNYVQERNEPGRLHCGPANLAGKIEPRRSRGFAHGIVGEKPLIRCEL